MTALEQLKKLAKTKLISDFGEREAMAMIRALEEDLFISRKEFLSPDETDQWNKSIKRLLSMEPVAYITGISYFLNLRLIVSPQVLIPRPETEELAMVAINFYKKQVNPNILDIGTGSGCLALALKSALPSAEVIGIDIKQDILDIAQANAAIHRLELSWMLLDFLDETTWPSVPFDLDLIISNPPYIGETEKGLMSASTLAYEPALAIFAGQDSLIFYKQIARFAKLHLKKRGRIMVEINEFAAVETTKVFSKMGYKEVKIKKDINGKDRMLIVS